MAQTLNNINGDDMSHTDIACNSFAKLQFRIEIQKQKAIIRFINDLKTFSAIRSPN